MIYIKKYIIIYIQKNLIGKTMSRKDPKMIAEIMKKNFKGAF